ncbi:hypothetical protein BHU11_09655 [Tannerella sp. oral taxon 808]|nr:hypothetical protein BHU11_09655 [Tannerella sp. oral taxon 808]
MEADMRFATIAIVVTIVHNVEGGVRVDIEVRGTKATTKIHREIIERRTALEILYDTTGMHKQVITSCTRGAKLNYAGDIVIISRK